MSGSSNWDSGEESLHINDAFIELLRYIFGPADWYDSPFALFWFLVVLFLAIIHFSDNKLAKEKHDKQRKQRLRDKVAFLRLPKSKQKQIKLRRKQELPGQQIEAGWNEFVWTAIILGVVLLVVVIFG